MTISNILQIPLANQMLLCHYFKLPNFQKTATLYWLKNMHAENLTRNQNHKYIIAKSLSAIGTENIKLSSENIQNTDVLRLSGRKMNLIETEMYLLLKILETKDLQ